MGSTRSILQGTLLLSSCQILCAVVVQARQIVGCTQAGKDRPCLVSMLPTGGEICVTPGDLRVDQPLVVGHAERLGGGEGLTPRLACGARPAVKPGIQTLIEERAGFG